MDSVPVTLTLEPRDWMSTEEGGTTLNPRLKTEEKGRPPLTRGFEVELRRRPGEGFGFVIASQDIENGRGEYFHDNWSVVFTSQVAIVIFGVTVWQEKWFILKHHFSK